MSNGLAESLSGESEGKRVAFRPTTASQRELLFRRYEETGSPRLASAAAHVGISTFYYWRKRFVAGGYAALREPRSHTPHTFANRLPEAVVAEVCAAKQEHPAWGRRRIADELRKEHGWQAVVSPSEVRRILIASGLWPEVIRSPKR